MQYVHIRYLQSDSLWNLPSMYFNIVRFFFNSCKSNISMNLECSVLKDGIKRHIFNLKNHFQISNLINAQLLDRRPTPYFAFYSPFYGICAWLLCRYVMITDDRSPLCLYAINIVNHAESYVIQTSILHNNHEILSLITLLAMRHSDWLMKCRDSSPMTLRDKTEYFDTFTYQLKNKIWKILLMI